MMNKVQYQYGYEHAQRDIDHACRKILKRAFGRHAYKFKYEAVLADGKKKLRTLTISADTEYDAKFMFMLAIHDSCHIKDIQEVR